MKKSITWATGPLRTLEIVLDAENPRIQASNRSSQAHIRQLLLDSEKVSELASSIVKSGALFAGERIIVTSENGEHVVLEGNRRVCACQILLDPSLIPTPHRGRFPQISGELRNRLSTLEADFAPNREAAEAIITRRHTQPGIEPWSPVAKQRRIAKLIESGASVKEVMDRFEMTKPAVTKLLKANAVMQFTRNLAGWNTDEHKLLESPRLKTNPFTRFFTLQGVSKTLGISFDAKGKLKTNLNGGDFEKAVERLARELLLPYARAETPELNTRAKPDEVFRKAFRGDSKLEGLLKKSSGQKGNGSLRARADVFFESLSCPIQDQQLLTLSQEISKIDHKHFKTASTFLLRALLERTLDWCIRKYELTHSLMKEFSQVGAIKKGKLQQEPGLDFKIRFCIKHHDEIFSGNARRNLEHWLHTKKLYDLVIHGKWAHASVPALEDAASTIRPFIENIFNGDALKQ